ncbi:MAG: MBL fold metallo-hydrolase [Rhodobacteraceae bacterium]|nr:MBL fold metallo-hydrolase [Paracoccaceae bacterium]
MTVLRPSRRDILKMSAAAPLLGLAAPAQANLGGPDGTQPSHFRFTLGEARLTVVSDGYFTGPLATVGVNADPEEVQAFMRTHFRSDTEVFNHTNHIIIELGAAKVLVDVGSGTRFAPTTGRLMENLETAGFAQEDITHVVLTHAHPDHVWGIRDDFDELVFPDAEYLIGSTEYDWWMKPGLIDEVPETLQQFVVGAVNSLSAEGLQINMAQDGHTVAPGITMIDTPGHTHGHMALHIESEGEQLLIVGDAIRRAFLNFARPDWYGAVDMDPEKTVSTRKRLLDMAATDGISMLGYHFPFPGVGNVMRDGDAYRFVPALWRWEK